MNITAETCSGIVREYDRQGWHRTGTEVDQRSAAWLVEEMGRRGVAAQLDTFPFLRVDVDPCSVVAGDWTVAGYPLPDGLLPPPGGTVTGNLDRVPGPGRVALARVDQHGRSAVLDDLRAQPWEAVIVAVEGTDEGLTLRNSWHYEAPSGPPMVQVPARAWEPLEKAREQRAPVTVRCGASRVLVEASNVVGRIPGRQSDLPPLVVLTPRSGWWHCAGERGGGIAAWLEVARLVGTLGLVRDVVLLATTGHEMGFMGVRRYLERVPALATGASLWIHLGANIGAIEAPTVVRAADREFLDVVRRVDAVAPRAPVSPVCELVNRPPGGEAAVVAAAGGRYISIVGRGFPLFHSTEDRWPRAIDAEAIAKNADLVLGLLRAFGTDS